jgi:sugar transferase (PEP-CTERM/EpsH1 system associated)
MSAVVTEKDKTTDRRYVIAHVIYRLQVGGLENGLVNLINNMPDDKYRHIIICVKEYTDFKDRIKRKDVEFYALNKKSGNDIGAHYRLWKILRKIRPTIMHTRNIGTIEYCITGKLAGVKYCVHGEHGRDMTDIDGTNNRYMYLRKFMSPFINRFIALSRDLEQWLIKEVKIPEHKVIQLYNGVDTNKFSPAKNMDRRAFESHHVAVEDIRIGTVGRFSEEKDQMTLVKAFISLLGRDDLSEVNIKLVLIGDGPLKTKLKEQLEASMALEMTEMPGECNDIPEKLRGLNIFVLPSLGEGISNTILEAMSSGLPVVATNVGGNPELVVNDETGYLVKSNNPDAIAEKLIFYIKNPQLLVKHGINSRRRAVGTFGMKKMVENYIGVYDALVSTG